MHNLRGGIQQSARGIQLDDETFVALTGGDLQSPGNITGGGGSDGTSNLDQPHLRRRSGHSQQPTPNPNAQTKPFHKLPISTGNLTEVRLAANDFGWRIGVGLGERTRPRVRRLTPRQPRPRAPPRVDPAWPGTRDFGMSPANRRRAGFPTCVPWPSRNGCERGCAPQATGFLLFGHNIPLNTARNHPYIYTNWVLIGFLWPGILSCPRFADRGAPTPITRRQRPMSPCRRAR